MNKQKFYTPIVSKKLQPANNDDYQMGLRVIEDTRLKYRDYQTNLFSADKIKSNPSFSLDRISTRAVEIAKSTLVPADKKKDTVRLPMIKSRPTNPEEIDSHLEENKKQQKGEGKGESTRVYYISNLSRCLRKHETTYLMNLYRQHFYQCIDVLRFAHPRKEIKLPKNCSHTKTIYLDMDETLIHCDERSNNYSVKLNFPLERGGILAAGVRVRPFCQQFLQELSKIAEIIIFTASASSYADVVLDYLDPESKWISHRMYRQHCTLEKGFYLKDLRVTNRKLEDVLLVDNSPYCHILQPDNGVPIVPFYHFAKDRELQYLLTFLKAAVQYEDMREAVRKHFFWDKYTQQSGDPRRIFFKNIQKQ